MTISAIRKVNQYLEVTDNGKHYRIAVRFEDTIVSAILIGRYKVLNIFFNTADSLFYATYEDSDGAQSTVQLGGGGALADLSDVDLTGLTDGYILYYDDASGSWKVKAEEAGVTDHGALTGLADDDHPQYTTDAEADAIADALIATHTSVDDAHHAKYTDAEAEAVITAELVDGESIDAAIDTLIASHAAEADPHAGYVKESEFTAAGDIVQGTGASAVAKLAIGSAGQKLMVNSGANALEYASGDILVAIPTAMVCAHYMSSSSPIVANLNANASGTNLYFASSVIAERFYLAAPGSGPNGSAYLRVRNSTREEYCWIANNLDYDGILTVTDAADIVGWQNGDTITTDTSPERDDADTTLIRWDLGPTIPAGAKGVLLALRVYDTTAPVGAKGLDARNGATDSPGYVYLNAASKYIITTVLIGVDSTDRYIFLRPRSSGANTLYSAVQALAYTI